MPRIRDLKCLVLIAIFLVGCSPAVAPVSGSGGRAGTGGVPAGSGGAASGGQNGTGGAPVVGSGGMAAGGSDGGASGGIVGSGGQNQDAGLGGGAGGQAGGGGRGGVVTADGGADSGASDGPAPFHPCPAAGTNCKIMPLGDSITEGAGSSGGGYRPELFRQALMNSKKITFVGRKVNGPTSVSVGGATTPFPGNHEGYSGYTIESGGGRTGINSPAIVEQALPMAQPHIVLLMIGTNDINLNMTNLPPRLALLLDRITTLAPNALLVVAKIVPTRTDATNTRVQSYNDAIPALVQARVAAGKHIILVDMYAALTADANYKTAFLIDDLHPTDAGYAVMARTWYAGIRSYLP